MVIERCLAQDCDRTANFILREGHRRRDPVVRLAKGFHQLVEMEKLRAERHGVTPAAPPSEPPPALPVPEPQTPEQAAVAQAEAAEKIRPRPHPADAMLWRRTGLWRQEMLGEQLLFGAVAEHAAAVRRGTFLEIEEVAAIEAAQIAAYEARQAEAAGAEPPEEPSPTVPQILDRLAASSPKDPLKLIGPPRPPDPRPRALRGRQTPQGP